MCVLCFFFLFLGKHRNKELAITLAIFFEGFIFLSREETLIFITFQTFFLF
jgi:hypothetical protein